MKKIFFYLIFLTSCIIGKQGVYFSEMSSKPNVKIENKEIIINTNNSKQNSSLAIQRLNIKVDTIKKSIFISAIQGLNNKRSKTFRFNLNKYKITQSSLYTIYWIDPDSKTTRIEL